MLLTYKIKIMINHILRNLTFLILLKQLSNKVSISILYYIGTLETVVWSKNKSNINHIICFISHLFSRLITKLNQSTINSIITNNIPIKATNGKELGLNKSINKDR